MFVILVVVLYACQDILFTSQIMFPLIELPNGRTCRRYINHVHTRFDTEENTTQYDADTPLIDNSTETNLTTDSEVTKSTSTPDLTFSVSTRISESTYATD